MLLSDFEDWLSETKKEIGENDNVSVSVNKVKVNCKDLMIFNVKVDGEIRKSKVW